MASLYEDLAAEDGANNAVNDDKHTEPEQANPKLTGAKDDRSPEYIGRAEPHMPEGPAGGNNQDAAPQQQAETAQPEQSKEPQTEEEKPPLVFVGGLSWSTTEAGFRMYLETFGPVNHIDFKRGFAFVHFATKEAVDACVQAGNEQLIDGKLVEIKIAEPHSTRNQFNNNRYGGAPAGAANAGSNSSTSMGASGADDDNKDAPGLNVGRKVFVGGLAQEVREAELRELMKHHGNIEDVVVMIDRVTGRSRGFGFVTFSTREEAEKASQQRRQILGGKSCEIKLYEPGARGNFHQNRTGNEGGGYPGPARGGYQHNQPNDWNRHRPYSAGGADARGSRPPYSQNQGGTQGYGQNNYYAGYYQQQPAGSAPYDYSQQQQQQQWGQYDYAAWGYGQGYYPQQQQGHPQQQANQPQQGGGRGGYQQGYQSGGRGGGYSGAPGGRRNDYGGNRT